MSVKLWKLKKEEYIKKDIVKRQYLTRIKSYWKTVGWTFSSYKENSSFANIAYICGEASSQMNLLSLTVLNLAQISTFDWNLNHNFT